MKKSFVEKPSSVLQYAKKRFPNNISLFISKGLEIFSTIFCQICMNGLCASVWNIEPAVKLKENRFGRELMASFYEPGKVNYKQPVNAK